MDKGSYYKKLLAVMNQHNHCHQSEVLVGCTFDIVSDIHLRMIYHSWYKTTIQYIHHSLQNYQFNVFGVLYIRFSFSLISKLLSTQWSQ